MYRGDAPVFCRDCGAKWTPGASDCRQCGAPAKAQPKGDGFGRKLPAFTPQAGLLRALTGLSVVYAAALVGELVQGWASRQVLLDIEQGLSPSLEVLEGFARGVWFMLASGAAYLGVIVLFGVWVVRAGRNLRARGILDTRDIDEARILWFFVPLVHLYRPLLGIRELWQGSRASDPEKWRRERVPVVLWVWWSVWLASNGLGNASLWWAWYGDDTPSTLLMANEYDLWRAATRVVCLPLFLAVVWGIERAQQRRR